MTIWGDMRGVDYNFFENAIFFNLETDFSLTFEIVTTMQNNSLLDPVTDHLLNPLLDSFLDPFLALLAPFLLLSKMTAILHT